MRNKKQALDRETTGYLMNYTISWPKKSIVMLAIPGAAAIIAGIVLLLLKHTGIGAAILVVGALCACLAVYFGLWRYRIDEGKLQFFLGLIKCRTIYWKEVKKVHMTKDTHDGMVTYALYSDKKILVEFTSAMEGFGHLMAMVKKKNIFVKNVKNVPITHYYKAR